MIKCLIDFFQAVKAFSAIQSKKEPSSPTIDRYFDATEPPYPRSHIKQIRFNQDFVECLTVSLIPVHSLTRKCFHKLIKGADARLTVSESLMTSKKACLTLLNTTDGTSSN